MNGEISRQGIIIKKSISNPETGGILTIVQKRDKVAESIGHVFAIPTQILLGRPQDIFINPPLELIDQILDRWKDVPWKGEVVVRMGHVDPIADWERARAYLQEEGKLNKWIDAVGAFHESILGIRKRLFRGSSYSPTTRTVHLMDPNLDVAMHELGHAEDRLNNTKRGGIFNRLSAETRASYNAMKHYKTDDERKAAMRTLEPAYGTYIGVYIQIIGWLLGLPVWSKPLVSKEIKTSRGRHMFRPKLPLAFLGSVALAHIYSRFPGRKSSFGYIFEGKNIPPEPLQPNQVRVATARAGS